MANLSLHSPAHPFSSDFAHPYYVVLGSFRERTKSIVVRGASWTKVGFVPLEWGRRRKKRPAGQIIFYMAAAASSGWLGLGGDSKPTFLVLSNSTL
jgi:hypothetical protein